MCLADQENFFTDFVKYTDKVGLTEVFLFGIGFM